MRIVGGALSGRRFTGPPGDVTRPTSERVREAIASALDARGAFATDVVLDLFAGTGALAFEALSRGAKRALLVERDRRVARAIEKSAAELGLADRVRVAVVDLSRAAPAVERIAAADGGPFGLVFADPPYDEIDSVRPLLSALAAKGALGEGAWVVIEHAAKRPPSFVTGAETLVGLDSVSTYRYGDTAVVIARREHSP